MSYQNNYLSLTSSFNNTFAYIGGDLGIGFDWGLPFSWGEMSM